VEASDIPGRVRWRPFVVLLGLLVAASAVYSLASWIRYEQFFAGNWDLGINMQLLWTNTHGFHLWEAGDYEAVHANSILYIHTIYVAIPLSYLYGFVPSASTLFALQAVAIASAIVPLYLIGRQARVPEWLLYTGLAVYLASFPVLSGFLFDFHWEAFIPAEFLWTFCLWERRRYWWAAVPVVVGCLTLEVFPFLVAGIVVFFAVPIFLDSSSGPIRRRLHGIVGTLRGPALPLVGLSVLAFSGFAILKLLSIYWLPVWIGSPPSLPPAPLDSALGIRLWGVSWSMLGDRLLYWFLLFASFGFLPLLLRQRLLILSAPWAIYTVFMTRFTVYTEFGFQYSLIAVAPLAISFIQGLGQLSSGPERDPHPSLSPVAWFLLVLPFLVASLADSVVLIERGMDAQWIAVEVALIVLGAGLTLRFVVHPGGKIRTRLARLTGARGRGRRIAKYALVGSMIVIVGTNIALSPFNPANFLGPGEGAYSFTYNPSPTFPYMSALVAEIPAGAPVLSSDNLFPFVANNPHAYSLLWYPAAPTYLPFNATHLPEYVLLSTSQWFAPSFLESALSKTSVYGLVTIIYTTASYPGSIFLYHLGYSGISKIVYATPFSTTTVLCGKDLAIGASGVVVPETGTRCGSVIESQPASNLSGNGATIWYGPYSTLLPGNYTVTISLEGGLSAPGSNNAPILVMNANALGTGYWYDVVITANQVSTTQWTNFTYHFHLLSPVPKAEWRGYLAGPTVDGQFVPGSTRLNFISIDYAPVSGQNP